MNISRREFLKSLLVGVPAAALVVKAATETKSLWRTTEYHVNASDQDFPVGMLAGSLGCPEGWIPCDGRVLRRSEYPELYSVINNSFGGGAGRFRVPDLRGKYWGRRV